jgi:hypothetical protein
MLLVFWLGTDLGVFLAAKRSERSDLSVETRSALLGLGMVLDRLPRSCLTLIVPSGLQMAINLGLVTVNSWVPLGFWLIAALWLIVLWTGFLNPGSRFEKPSMLINFALNALMALILTPLGIYLLINGSIADWLSIKILIIGAIFCTGVVLDILFKPAIEAFTVILTEGASTERDAAYARAIRPVYGAVLMIYALVAIAAYLGIAKPLLA